MFCVVQGVLQSHLVYEWSVTSALAVSARCSSLRPSLGFCSPAGMAVLLPGLFCPQPYHLSSGRDPVRVHKLTGHRGSGKNGIPRRRHHFTPQASREPLTQHLPFFSSFSWETETNNYLSSLVILLNSLELRWGYSSQNR